MRESRRRSPNVVVTRRCPRTQQGSCAIISAVLDSARRCINLDRVCSGHSKLLSLRYRDFELPYASHTAAITAQIRSSFSGQLSRGPQFAFLCPFGIRFGSIHRACAFCACRTLRSRHSKLSPSGAPPSPSVSDLST
jgi:hypothetical protein